jgi:sigma-B regulation protein RsbU (phosphoserine phosphatase)
MLLEDYAAAAAIQARMLPRKPLALSTLDLAACSRPASHLSGDFFDFIPFGERKLGILVGDAMGKGLAGALLMMQARAVVRTLAASTPSPGALLREANRILSPDLRGGLFVTLLLAVMDLGTGELRVANAGHPPVLSWHPSTGRCSELSIGGFALGVAQDALFNRSIIETELSLEPGSRFILYSDGVTELRNRQTQEYGKCRLIRALLRDTTSSSAEFLNRLLRELDSHRSGTPQSDDLTVVTGRFLCPSGADGRPARSTYCYSRGAGIASRRILVRPGTSGLDETDLP